MISIGQCFINVNERMSTMTDKLKTINSSFFSDKQITENSQQNSIKKIRNLLIVIGILLFIWLIVIPFGTWLYTIYSKDSELIDRRLIKEFIRDEIEKSLNQFQLKCKSNQQCVSYQNYIPKNEERSFSSLFSWFDNGQKIKFLIDEAIRKYDSDNIGLADYALESVGGSVLVKYSSKTYTDRSPTLNIFGLAILKRTITPNMILRKGIMPGNCWPMIGTHGYVIINLAFPVQPTMFTLEHLPKTLSFDGQSRSAPKEFSIRGLNSIDHQGEFLGRYIYDTTTIGVSHIQTFHVQSKDNQIFYRLIKLIIESNWGHPQYTCIYRFRVHGQPDLPPSY